MEKYFVTQQDDEEVRLLIRKHWFVLLPGIVSSFFFYILGLISIILIPAVFPIVTEPFVINIYVLIVSLGFLFNTAGLFSLWLIHYLNVGIITTEHIVQIDQVSLFNRKISQLGLDKIQDVTSSQKGMTQDILDFGNIVVQTAGELPNFNFENVPRPNQNAQLIMELEEEYSVKHGIREEISNPVPKQENENL